MFLLFGALKYATAQTVITPAQSDTPDVEDVEIFTFVEQMPEFQGDIYGFLAKHIKYPAKAREKEIQGRVLAQFVINEQGEITQIDILRSPDELLSKEAVRVIELMPAWRPGKQNGKPVNVRYTLPIVFKLK